METERFDTVVIGAGQGGLSAAYYLQRAGRPFVILEGHPRVGDNWRERYDSLRLFTPAYGVSLVGFPYKKKGQICPTKDEMADYLERYAEHFGFPIRLGVRVTGLTREGDTYVVGTIGGSRFEAANVIVASGAHREPRVPAFATQLDPSIVQMHSTEYRNPTQLPTGGVLVVGAGNSGADIALEVARTHPTWLSGPERGHIPVDIDGWVSRHIAFHVVRFIGMHVQTIRTPMGRKARDKELNQGTMLVRVKPKQILAAGVSVGRQDHRRHGRHADGRGRAGAEGGHDRDLVHGQPARPVVDRPADLRGGRAPDARPRRRARRAGPRISWGCRSSSPRRRTCCRAWRATRATW